MRWAAVLMAFVLSALAACDMDSGSGGAGAQSGFRNLGKRADSNLGGERSTAAR